MASILHLVAMLFLCQQSRRMIHHSATFNEHPSLQR